MKIHVVGAGAIGTYLSVVLAPFVDLDVLVRDEALADALGAEPFTLEGVIETKRIVSVRALADARIEPGDQVVLTTKAGDLASALEIVDGLLPEGASVVLAQNGLGVLEDARDLTDAPIVRAACWMGVRLVERGRAVVAGVHALALAPGSERAEERDASTRLAELARVAGLPVREEPDARSLEWRKALWNLAVNGLCAIVDGENGAILDDPHLRTASEGLLDEAFAVARAEGVSLDESDRARVYASLETTRRNVNATLQDLRRGRPTETRWLAGAVARIGRERGVPTPRHDQLVALLGALERRALVQARADEA
jgi:2-dehydropantoate 2-reductase